MTAVLRSFPLSDESKPYIDIYFKPKAFDVLDESEKQLWQKGEKSPRLRFCRGKARLLFSHVRLIERSGFAVKQSVYGREKLVLFEAGIEEAHGLAGDLGFEEWLTIRKLRAHE